MKNRSIFYIIIAIISFLSCTGKKNNEQNAVIPDNLIIITPEQFEAGKLVLGEPGIMKFDETIS